MSLQELRELAGRADDVEGRPDARLEEVAARIRTVRRRRQAGAVLATVVAVVLVLLVGTAVVRTGTARPPVAPGTPTPTTAPTPEPTVLVPRGPSQRRLTWARGHTIHWGDERIDAGGKVWEVAATDDGVVFMRAVPRDCFRIVDDEAVPLPRAGCNELWFTDGTAPRRIGTVYGSVIRGFHLETSVAGSTVVWFEPAPADHPHGSGYSYTGTYVVFDTHRRAEVARFGASTDSLGVDAEIVAVFDDYVYWLPDDRDAEWCARWSRYYGSCRRHRAVMRLDTSTGSQAKVPWSAYVADRGSRSRMLVGGPDRPGQPYRFLGQPGAWSERIGLGRVGDRLVAKDENGDALTLRRASSGEEVRLRLPRGYVGPDVGIYTLLQWLDDDRVVVDPEDTGDLLVCRLPAGRCRVAATGVQLASFRSWG